MKVFHDLDMNSIKLMWNTLAKCGKIRMIDEPTFKGRDVEFLFQILSLDTFLYKSITKVKSKVDFDMVENLGPFCYYLS